MKNIFRRPQKCEVRGNPPVVQRLKKENRGWFDCFLYYVSIAVVPVDFTREEYIVSQMKTLSIRAKQLEITASHVHSYRRRGDGLNGKQSAHLITPAIQETDGH